MHNAPRICLPQQHEIPFVGMFAEIISNCRAVTAIELVRACLKVYLYCIAVSNFDQTTSA